jgi:Fe-S-cluster containining protein
MYIPYSGSVTDSFPEAREVPYYNLGDLSLPGVYYVKFRERFLVRIVGKCPNLGEDLNCGIYETRPEGCRNFEKDGKYCLDARKFFQKESKDFRFPTLASG